MNHPERVIPTEETVEQYYGYDLELIRAVLHNFSLLGVENPQAHIEYDRNKDEITVQRSECEELSVFTDPRDQSVMIAVSDPNSEDAYYEMTMIVLSRHEARTLRSLLNTMQW